jgi:NMD protein affecting ribosome stability and mRNA decay
MAEKKEQQEPKQASADHILVALCKQCGEIRRRKFRSDALEGVRKHLADHKSHDCEVVERKAEEKPAKKKPAASKKSKAKGSKKPKPEAKQAQAA